MAKNLTPAKTPGVAVARVLRGLGLKQGLDFGVRGERKNGERIGTRVAVFGQRANQIVADNANVIERAAADAGFHFNVSVYFTPSGSVWVAVANFGQRTRQTHFLSATPAEPVTTVDTAEDAEAKTLRDRAVALADDSMAEPKPVIRATLGEPRPAFGQDAVKHGIRTRTAAPKPAEASPYAGRATRTFGSRTWGCGEAGQMWFHQRTDHGPRHVLRVYLGRVRANGWYLSGPGINGDAFLAGTLTVAARRANVLLDGVSELTDAMEQVIVDWPKGQRVQGVDTYGVTCMGTVNGVAWGAVTQLGHENYGRTWADVDWDEMPHNRGTGRRGRPFTSDLIKH
ncbi:hypothetical protein SEA_YDN12_61 [Streptomyces phage YDN12]|uniref:Uncharacterized protein n=1 Tax=Streptomyces phage YDN12 TaxID=1636183 RepID=A0A0E3M308_9CAUD|nr:hypothetical protein AVT63_gp60 [Streptomyces phage YDN12]AKA61728.1 hypothetical protein SEA_YDN12_61 [Streptomyces phage YDN12]